MSGDPFDYASGVRLSAGQFVVHVFIGHPATWERLAAEAKLVDAVDLRESTGRPCSITVWERGRVLLLASFRYDLDRGLGPAVALVPESRTLFVGAGEEIYCYDLATPKRLWRDNADTGIWSWEVVGDTVLMSAELEFAAWDKAGTKLWTRFVEPPWSYETSSGIVRLDIMGAESEFDLRGGPKPPRQVR